MPGGKKHCDHQGHRARVSGSSRAGLCTRDKVTVTQKYVLARIHYTHSGKIRYLLIAFPALANVQRAAGDEPKPFPLSYRDLRLVHCVYAAHPSVSSRAPPPVTPRQEIVSLATRGDGSKVTAEILSLFFSNNYPGSFGPLGAEQGFS